MSWYYSIKQAAPAIYSPKLIPRVEQSKWGNVEHDVADKFFRYLCRSKLSHTFYHGTSAATYGKILDNGAMVSPENTQSRQYESHNTTQKQLFFSANRESAGGYASRAAGDSSSEAVMLEFVLPLYIVAEIRAAIFRPVEHPIHYNEQGYHQDLAEIVQPALAALKAEMDGKNKQQRKTLENSTYENLANQIHKFVSKKRSDNDEWTVTNGVQMRFLKQVHLTGSYGSLSQKAKAKTITALNAKLKTDKNLRAKLKENLQEEPGNFSLLSEKYKKSKTLQKITQKSWLNKIINDPHNTRVVETLPNLFASSPEILAHTKNKIPDILRKITDAYSDYDLTNILTNIPVPFQAIPQISQAIKAKFLEVSKSKSRSAESISNLSNVILKDGPFVAQVLGDFDGLGPDEITSYANSWPPLLSQNPAVYKAVFAKGNLLNLTFEHWPLRVLKQNEAVIRQQLNNIILNGNNSILKSKFKSVPTFLLDNTIVDNYRQRLLTELQDPDRTDYVLRHLQNIPAPLLNEPELLSKVVPALSNENSMAAWVNVPDAIKNLPELKDQWTGVSLLHSGLASIKYDDLPPKFHQQYIDKVIAELPQRPNLFKFIDKKIAFMPEIIAAVAEGYMLWASRGDIDSINEIPSELLENPTFAPYITKIQGSLKLKGSNWRYLDYNTLEEELKPMWEKKATDHLSGYPEFYDKLPENMKQKPEVAAKAALAYFDKISYNSDVVIPENIWNILTPEYKDIIQKRCISYGYITALPFNGLPPELKETYLKKVIDDIQYAPDKWEKLPPSVKNMPEVIKALGEGWKYYTENGYGVPPKHVQNMPEMAEHGDHFATHSIQYYTNKLMYDPPAYSTFWTIIDQAPPQCFKNDEFVKLLVMKLPLSVFDSLYQGTTRTAGLQKLYTEIDQKIKNPEVSKQLKEAVFSGIENNLGKYLSMFPGEFTQIPEDDQKTFPNAQKKALIGTFNKNYYVEDKYYAYTTFAQYYPQDPYLATMMEQMAETVATKIQESDGPDKTYWCNWAKERNIGSSALNSMCMVPQQPVPVQQVTNSPQQQ